MREYLGWSSHQQAWHGFPLLTTRLQAPRPALYSVEALLRVGMVRTCQLGSTCRCKP
jgi:hypothetical protein